MTTPSRSPAALVLLGVASCLVLASCDGERARSSGTSRPRELADAGPGGDGSPVEGMGADAAARDAGPTAGTDAALVEDGSAPGDSGTPASLDSGAPVSPDAGAPRDAGPPDSGVPPTPYCVLTCATPSDCVTTGGAFYDADNYACRSGRCEHIGCNNTAECASIAAGYVCAPVPGATLSSCYRGCTSSADCTTPGSPLFDADNYTCSGGICLWGGCNDTAECTSAFGSNNYTCTQVQGLTFRNCLETCSTASDCATPASPLYDSDNYACRGGECVWTGCNSTNECTSALSDPRYACF